VRRNSKLAGTGCALPSRRVYLWPDRLLYLGPLGQVGAHRHAAAVILAGLYAPFRIAAARSRDWHETRSALVGAGCPHRLDIGGAVMAVFYVDPECDDPQFVGEQAGAGGMRLGLEQEAGWLAAFREIYEQALPLAAAHALLQQRLEPQRRQRRPLDPRVQAATQTLRRNDTGPQPLEALAREAGLSPGRFMHLFRQTTGVPPRRFRVWNRLRETAQHYAAGHSLTDAALAAGFASSSHFAHAFRDMFGIAPREVLRRDCSTQLLLGEAQS